MGDGKQRGREIHRACNGSERGEIEPPIMRVKMHLFVAAISIGSTSHKARKISRGQLEV